MKKWGVVLLVLLLPVPASAGTDAYAARKEHRMPAGYEDVHTHPKTGEGIKKYADDDDAGAQKNFGVQPVHDNEVFAVFSADRFEYRTGDEDDILLWDVQAWVGEDYNKLWFESEGAWSVEAEKFEEVQTELFYSRNIATFWDLRIGARHDFEPDPSRTFAALGVQGLAPLWFEIDATVYLSEDGDLSAALEAEYDLLLSQRLILQPRFEAGAGSDEVREYGEGAGIRDIELGVRLRYEIHRKFAPYLGVSWHRLLGETEDFAEAAGKDTDMVSWICGVRFWF